MLLETACSPWEVPAGVGGDGRLLEGQRIDKHHSNQTSWLLQHMLELQRTRIPVVDLESLHIAWVVDKKVREVVREHEAVRAIASLTQRVVLHPGK